MGAYMNEQLRYRKGDKIGGRYLVHQALSGGMGEVYLCLDLQENFPCALKTFQARYLSSPKAREYFDREAAIWVALEKHANIVRCFYMDRVDNTSYLFLEWIAGIDGDGTDLRDWLDRRGPLDSRRALEFTMDVCRALVHAHRKVPGFVHCDIKPENILVSQGQLAKLTDFGLAKLVREAGLVSHNEGLPAAGGRWQVSSAGGTPPYMAPEQWRGEAVDARTDVYAVGCLLYELLTGRWPFQAATVDDLKRRHLESPPAALGAGLRGLPGEMLDALLMRCLAKEKGERYPSASELIDAIAGLYEAWHEAPPREVPESASLTAPDYGNRGKTYAALGRRTEALADFDEAIRLDPNDAIAYTNRGLTYADSGRHSKALADHDAAIRRDPTLATAYTNRGNTYRALNRHEAALADHDAAIRLDPKLALAYSNRGISFRALGRHIEALADYEAAIRLDPNFAMARNNRGNAYGALGRSVEALEDYEAAIRLDPNFAMAIFNRGNTYKSLGRRVEALADYDATLRLDPNFAQARNNRGITYAELGRQADALADFEAAIRLDPNYAEAFLNKGAIHIQRDERDDALRAFEAAACLGDHRGAQCAAQARHDMGLSAEPAPASPAHWAIEAFLDADGPDALGQALDRHPILAQPDLLAALEQFIAQRVPAPQRPTFRQRLDWLRQLTAPKANP
jgi:serine/threonine protein kinase